MKKISLLGIILATALLIGGCTNKVAEEALQQAVDSIDEKNYQQALTSLEVVLEEDKGNKEAEKLKYIIEDYQKIVTLIEEKNIEAAKDTLESINEEYQNYSIKSDIESLSSELDNINGEIQNINDYLEEAERLIINEHFKDAKEYLIERILGLNDMSKHVEKYILEEQLAKAKELLATAEEGIKKQREKEEEERLAAEATRKELLDKAVSIVDNSNEVERIKARLFEGDHKFTYMEREIEVDGVDGVEVEFFIDNEARGAYERLGTFFLTDLDTIYLLDVVDNKYILVD